MSEADATYQTKVGKLRDGEGFFCREDGFHKFWDENFLGTMLRALARSNKVVTITNLSTASTTLSDYGGSSPPVLPSEYGTIIVEATDTGTNLSARLPSALSGAFMEILLRGGSVASLIIYCSGHTSGITGAAVVGLHHSGTASQLSSISLRQSAGSFARVTLRGTGSGTWAVIEADTVNNVTERRA